jgi:hypothetical protein
MSGNGEYGAARETVLAEAREHALMLASEGLPARDIAHRLDHGLTATERELLWGIASQAVAEAARPAASAQPSLAAAAGDPAPGEYFRLGRVQPPGLRAQAGPLRVGRRVRVRSR